MPLAERFAKQLKQTRLTKKFSQQALAEKAGISVAYISMLERGLRSPPLGTIERVAKALSVTPLMLLA